MHALRTNKMPSSQQTYSQPVSRTDRQLAVLAFRPKKTPSCLQPKAITQQPQTLNQVRLAILSQSHICACVTNQPANQLNDRPLSMLRDQTKCQTAITVEANTQREIVIVHLNSRNSIVCLHTLSLPVARLTVPLQHVKYKKRKPVFSWPSNPTI